MNPEKIISDFKELNIELRVEGNNLKYRSPKGVLTENLKSLLRDNKDSIIEYLSKTKNKTGYSLSYNQQSLWFMYLMHPESAAYNVASSFRVMSVIDVKGLQFAFNKLLEQHQILRTTYYISGNNVVQKVNDFCEIPIELVNVTGLGDSEIKKIVSDYYKKPFNIERGPVIRLIIFQLSSEEHIFQFVIHHIACDALSLRMLLDAFSEYYNCYLNNSETYRPATANNYSYIDFIDYQNSLLSDKLKRKELFDFWNCQLADKPKTSIPRDFEYTESFRPNGSSFYFNIKNGNYEKLLHLSRNLQISLNSAIFSLFEILLFSLTRENEITFGFLSSGRSRKEHFDVCGYFVNPLIRRSELKPGFSFKEYACLSHKEILKALDHQDYPFPLLVEELEKERDFKTTPGFRILYNYMNRQLLGILSDLLTETGDKTPTMWGSLPVVAYPLDQQEGQFEITFEIIDNDSSLYCNIKYNTDLYKRETIDKIHSGFLKILSAVLNNPDVKIMELISDNGIMNAMEGRKEFKQLAIAANFTIESVALPVEFWLDNLEMNFKIEFAPYNQIFQQLLDKGSVFHKNKSGINIIILRLEEWIIDGSGALQSYDLYSNRFNDSKKDFLKAFAYYNGNHPVTTFIICTPYSTGIKNNTELYSFLLASENEICEELNNVNNVYAFTHVNIDALYPVENYYEELGEKIGHMPFSSAYFAAIGTFVVRKLFAFYHKPYKVIVLDCDNTLWNGVIGEEGLLGIIIDEDKRSFQHFLLDQFNSGMILCLCSKNNPDDVLNVLEKHPDMIIRNNNITASRVNWSLKSENIVDLAKELNLGIDSFIFVDDNPVECSEVSARCPEVLVINLPGENISQYFKHLWVFDKFKITKDDLTRADFYRSDIKRKQLSRETFNFNDFIEKLGIKIGIEELGNDEVDRASQMTQRVNQFNLSTIRRDEGGILKLVNDEKAKIYSVHVSDRFGDYGLVGLIILLKESNKIILDTFLLSCRALGKGVEHAMLNKLGEFALDTNIDMIEIEYIRTGRNTPISNFLETNLNTFKQTSNGRIIYLVPPAEAVKVKFKSDVSTETVEEETSEKKISDANSVIYSKEKQIPVIAQDFDNVDKIVTGIRNWTKRKQTQKIKNSETGNRINFNELEEILNKIWQDTLQHDNFSVTDNFFEIGGKSILIPPIVIRLKKEHNIELSIVDLFKYPSIRKLAENIAGIKIDKDHFSDKLDTSRLREAKNKQKLRIKKARGLINPE